MTKKRASLATLNKAITKATTKTTAAPVAAPERTTITGINLPVATLVLLRTVAAKRAGQAGGGRPSVSAVIVALVEKHRAELDAE
jgi:hypothetical protein